MISLKKISGLPMFLTKNTITFSPVLKHAKIERRYYKGYEKFFMPSEHIAGIDFSRPLYYIYRNVRYPAHDLLFKKQGIRFDVTVLRPGQLGRQAVRTVGHIHTKIIQESGPTYKQRPSETYQVLYGNGLFYLQHEKKNIAHIIRAKMGSMVYIPGEYGHITINASRTKPLVIANIFIRKKHSSDYGFFRKTHGPKFFPVWKKSKIIFEPNQKQKASILHRKNAKKGTSPLYPFLLS